MAAKRPNHFWSGALFVIGVDMGVQDLYGLDGWITHLRADWITLSPFWGFAVAAIAVLGSWLLDLAADWKDAHASKR